MEKNSMGFLRAWMMNTFILRCRLKRPHIIRGIINTDSRAALVTDMVAMAVFRGTELRADTVRLVMVQVIRKLDFILAMVILLADLPVLFCRLRRLLRLVRCLGISCEINEGFPYNEGVGNVC